MIGVHDVGGYHFPTPIDTRDEVTFHSDWEATTFAMLLAASTVGTWSLDEFRHKIELMPRGEYLSTPYYVHWLASLEQLSINEGWFSPSELMARQDDVREGRDLPDAPEVDPAKAEAMSEGAQEIAFVGLGARRTDLPQSFAVGDRIKAQKRAVPGHTRLPWYIWDKVGTIVAYSGTYPLPDTLAHRQGENPEPVFAVQFDAVELWGDVAEPRTSITIDLWESYMDHFDKAEFS